MADNGMYIHLGLDNSEFNKRLKKTFTDADLLTSKGLTAVIKAKYEFPNAAELQKELKKALKGAEGITYKGKGGSILTIGKNDFAGVEKAYAQLDKKVRRHIQLTDEEAKHHERLGRVMRAVANISSAKYKYDTQQMSIERAVARGERRKIERQASKDPNAEQDKLTRRRYIAFAAEQAKDERRAEQERKQREKEQAQWSKNRQQQLANERKEISRNNAEWKAYWQSFDRQANAYKKGGNSNAELASMRSYYAEQVKAAEKKFKSTSIEEYQMRRAQLQNELQTPFMQMMPKARASVQAEIAELDKLIARKNEDGKATQKRLREQKQATDANDRLANAQKNLTTAEKEYNAAQKQNKGRNTQEFQKEITALNNLIRKREKYLQLLTGRKNVSNDATLQDYNRRLQNLKNQQRQLQEINNEYGRQGSLLSRLGGLLTRYFNLYSLVNFSKKVAETTAYFERQRVSLEGITGSAAKANEVLEQLTDFATHSPFKAKDLIGFAKQLGAFSIPADDLVDTTKKLADISAGLGVDMSRIILAYGQVRSASVLRGQELRQFTEAGIPMVQALSDKFTQLNGELVTTGDIFEMISKRQVSFEMVDSVLSDMAAEGGKFYKMQENLSETMYGQIQKLSDLWAIAMNDIGKSNNGTFTNIIKLLQWVAKNAQAVGKALIVAFSVQWITTFVNYLNEARKRLALMTKGAQSFGRVWRTAGGAISAGIGIIIGLFSSLWREANKVRNKIKDIQTSYQKDNDRMISGLNSLLNKLKTAQRNTEEYAKAIDTLKTNYSEFINVDSMYFQGLLAETNQTQELADKYGTLRDAIQAAINAKNDYNAIVAIKDSMADEIIGWSKSSLWKTFFSKSNAEDIINKKLGELSENQYDKELKNNPRYAIGYSQWGDKYNKNGDALKKDMNAVFQTALSRFLSDNKTNENELYTYFERALKENFFDIKVDYSGALQDLTHSLFVNMSNEKSFEEYVRNANILNGAATENNLVSMRIRAEEEFGDITGDIDGTQIQKIEDRNRRYINALQSLVRGDIKIVAANFGVDISALEDLVRGDWSKSIAELENTGAYNNETTRKLLEELLNVQKKFGSLENGIGAGAASYIDRVIQLFKSGTITQTAHQAHISSILSTLYGNAGVETYGDNNFDVKKFVDRYNPLSTENKDKTIYGIAQDVSKELSDVVGKIDFYRNKKAEPYNNEIQLLERKEQILRRLAEPDLYNFSPIDKKNKGDYSRIFAQFKNRIKESIKEQKQMEEAFGQGQAFFDEVNKLNNNTILKQFVTAAEKQTNPFQDYINELKAIGIDVSKYQDIKGYSIKVNNYLFLDYQKIWEDAEAQVAEKVKKTSGIEKKEWERVLEELKNEGDQLFGRDEIKKKIDAMLLDLRHINSSTKNQVETLNTYKQLSEQVGWENAQKIMTDNDNSNENIYYSNISELYRKQLKESLDKNTGMKEYFNSLDKNNRLSSGNLNITNLSFLSDLLTKLTDPNAIIESLTGEDLKTVRTQYVEILKKLIESIKKESAEVSKLASKDEQTARTISSINKELEDTKTAINGSQTQEINDKSQATLEYTQQYYDKIRKALGGSETKSWQKRLFGDANSNMGISKKGLLIGTLLDMAIGGGASLFQLIANREANGTLDETAIKELTDLNEKLNMTNDIVEASTESIKAMNDITEGLIKMIESFNGLKVTRDGNGNIAIDENGNVQASNKMNANAIAQTRKVLEISNGINEGIGNMWKSLFSGNIIGVGVGFITMWADLIRGINELVDLEKTQRQEKLGKDIERIDRSINTLQFKQDFLAGWDKVASRSQEIADNLEQSRLAQQQLNIETEKKAGDEEKAQEYADQVVGKRRQALQLIREMREEIVGTADDLSSRLTDALVGAFREGTNAARAWRDQVRQYIGDMLKETLLSRVFAPQIKNILDTFLGGTEEELADRYGSGVSDYLQKRIADPTLVKSLADSLDGIGISMIDFHNSLDDTLKKFIDYNSSISSLSGGIESITEDTARRVEALSNAQLGEQVMIRSLLQQYLPLIIDGSQMATIQSAVVQMNSNVYIIAQVSKAIERHIYDVRYTQANPINVRVV